MGNNNNNNDESFNLNEQVTPKTRIKNLTSTSTHQQQNSNSGSNSTNNSQNYFLILFGQLKDTLNNKISEFISRHDLDGNYTFVEPRYRESFFFFKEIYFLFFF
jgi:hypothetical protein